MADIWIITGKQNSGKTVMILEIIDHARKGNIPICGLISPGVYENNVRTSIQVVDIESMESKILADLKPGWDPNNTNKKWKMRDGTIKWGSEQLQRMNVKGKIFFLDELGVYELLERKGWQAGLKIIKEKDYLHAVIAVRKDVLNRVIKICEKEKINYELIDLDVLSKPEKVIIQEIYKKLLK